MREVHFTVPALPLYESDSQKPKKRAQPNFPYTAPFGPTTGAPDSYGDSLHPIFRPKTGHFGPPDHHRPLSSKKTSLANREFATTKKSDPRNRTGATFKPPNASGMAGIVRVIPKLVRTRSWGPKRRLPGPFGPPGAPWAPWAPTIAPALSRKGSVETFPISHFRRPTIPASSSGSAGPVIKKQHAKLRLP